MPRRQLSPEPRPPPYRGRRRGCRDGKPSYQPNVGLLQQLHPNTKLSDPEDTEKPSHVKVRARRRFLHPAPLPSLPPVAAPSSGDRGHLRSNTHNRARRGLVAGSWMMGGLKLHQPPIQRALAPPGTQGSMLALVPKLPPGGPPPAAPASPPPPPGWDYRGPRPELSRGTNLPSD